MSTSPTGSSPAVIVNDLKVNLHIKESEQLIANAQEAIYAFARDIIAKINNTNRDEMINQLSYHLKALIMHERTLESQINLLKILLEKTRVSFLASQDLIQTNGNLSKNAQLCLQVREAVEKNFGPKKPMQS